MINHVPDWKEGLVLLTNKTMPELNKKHLSKDVAIYLAANCKTDGHKRPC